MSEKTDLEPRRLLGRDFLLVCASNFLAFFSIYLIIPVLPLFLEEERGYSNFLIGALMSMLVVAALLRPFLGRASDLRGRKFLLVSGTLLLGITNFLYIAFQTALPLFFVRFINGLGLAAFHTSSYAFVGDLAPPSRRLQGIALFFISVDLAIGGAPLVAEIIKDAGGYNPVYLLAGALALLAFLCSLTVREAKRSEFSTGTISLFRARPNRLQGAIFLATAGFTLTLGALSTFIVLSAKESGSGQGELFFTIFAATLITYRLLVGRRADRWPRRPLIAFSGVLALGGLVVIALSSHIVVLILGTLVYALGFAYIPTTLSALLLDHTSTRNRGVMLGVFMAVFDVGIGLGGLALGPVADVWGYPAMYVVSGGVALVGLVYFLLATAGRLKTDSE